MSRQPSRHHCGRRHRGAGRPFRAPRRGHQQCQAQRLDGPIGGQTAQPPAPAALDALPCSSASLSTPAATNCSASAGGSRPSSRSQAGPAGPRWFPAPAGPGSAVGAAEPSAGGAGTGWMPLPVRRPGRITATPGQRACALHHGGMRATCAAGVVHEQVGDVVQAQ